MGLDMYLYVKKFFASSPWSEMNDRSQVEEVAKMMKAENLLFDGQDLQFAHVELEIAYWRKANQVHKFFVDTCADGVDECQETYVSVESLKDLLSRCEKVLADHSLAEELLPTGAGFFFGSTDYGEYYYEDLQNTVNKLTKIIPIIEANIDWDIYYKASW